MSGAGEGLQAINTGSWQGPAAQAFHDKFSYEPGKWFAAGDAFESGASVLEDYANTLRWAQAQALEAIQQRNQGDAATERARAAHATATAQATAANQPPPAFTDPGETSRQAARDLLNRARTQLAEAGDLAAGTLRGLAATAPDTSSWIDDVGNFVADAGAQIVNTLASFSNAIVNHPGDLVEAAAGIGLTVISSAGEGLGLVLDATGIGAAAGVPLNVVSAAGIATGAGLTAHAMTSMAMSAAGDDHVEPVKTSRDGGDSGPTPPRPGKPVAREDLSPGQEANLKRYEKKLPATAEETKITQLEDGSIQMESRVPGRVPGSSATYTKVVSEDGTTMGYTKTTTLPDGSIAHVKDKMPK
ncbi:hypothetical protein D5S19_23680 [Amycolatopsis panacis]|uniref:Putative T7SS secretion signal domain-containing protein n=2 Tax=Amycolatopsis panacis TaxID=2340917 RepID=A0A419HWR3_9PSEU|nr:hypothetical protein D5S19_23680 [Amycolatopsis panacis]